jgi:hypothetical protein
MNGSSVRGRTDSFSIRSDLFSAAITKTSAAVPDDNRVCSVEMYSATGGALENSTVMSGFAVSNASMIGSMTGWPSQEKNVRFVPSLAPASPPEQAVSSRSEPAAVVARTVRASRRPPVEVVRRG